MIGYVTIGALNVEEAMPFYDAVLGAIGYERQFFDAGWPAMAPRARTPTPSSARPSTARPPSAATA